MSRIQFINSNMYKIKGKRIFEQGFKFAVGDKLKLIKKEKLGHYHPWEIGYIVHVSGLYNSGTGCEGYHFKEDGGIDPGGFWDKLDIERDFELVED